MTRRPSHAWSWTLVLLTIAACYLFVVPFYGSCDEDGMRAMLEGRMSPTGEPYPYMVWVNILVGYVLAPLYRHWPHGYWYDLYLLGCLAVSAATILAIFLRRAPDRITRIVAAALAAGWLAVTVLSMTFSLTSAMLLAAGWIAFLDIFHRPQPRARDYLPAMALLLLSSFTRIDVFLHLLPLLLAASLPFLVGRMPPKRNLLLAAALLALTYLLALACLYYDNRMSIPGAADFWRFNDLRVQLVDYLNSGMADRPALLPILAKAGWSEQQYHLLQSWFFYDSRLFNLDTLQRLVDAFRASPLPLRGSFPYPPSVELQRSYLILLLFSPLLARNPIHAVYMLGLALFYTAIYMGATFVYKTPPGYIFSGIALALGLLGFYGATVWPERGWKLPRVLALLPLALMAGVVLHLGHEAIRYDRRATIEATERRELLARDDAKIIITWGPIYLYTRPFHPLPELQGRVQINGGSFSPLAYTQHTLAAYGLQKDFTRSLCTRPDVAILGNLDADYAMPDLQQLVRRDYGMNVTFERVYDGIMHRLYRCRRS